jgi:hypothetical protein
LWRRQRRRQQQQQQAVIGMGSALALGVAFKYLSPCFGLPPLPRAPIPIPERRCAPVPASLLSSVAHPCFSPVPRPTPLPLNLACLAAGPLCSCGRSAPSCPLEHPTTARSALAQDHGGSGGSCDGGDGGGGVWDGGSGGTGAGGTARVCSHIRLSSQPPARQDRLRQK